MERLTTAAPSRANHFLSTALLCTALFAAPAHAALVEFVLRGNLGQFNPNYGPPGIAVGQPIEASFVVNTGCGPRSYNFSDDADPVLLDAGINPVFLRMHARIGSFEIHSDRGLEQPPGQVGIYDARDGIFRVYINANGWTPQWQDWNIWIPGLQHSAPIFRRELDAGDLIASALLLFTERGPFDVQVGGSKLGWYAFVPADVQVRLVQEDAGPCHVPGGGVQLPERRHLGPTQKLAPDPSEASPAPGELRSLAFGQEITRHDNTALIWEPGFPESPGGGRVAVFTRNGQGKWVRNGSIDAPSGNEHFGKQMAIFNDVALIESDTHAFLYRRVQGQWKRIQVLTPQSGYTFTEPTIWNNWAFIGASSATAGAVYVYQFTDTGTLRGVQTLRSYSGDPADRFGEHVVISNARALVTASGDANSRGAAYVFELNGSLFAKRQKLIGINGAANDQFGTAAGISGDWIAVGAPRVAGPQGDDCIGGRNTGAIYVFRRVNGTWLQQDALLAADARDSTLPCVESLGKDLMISGNWLVAANQTDNPNAPLFTPIIYKRDDARFTPRADGDAISTQIRIHLSNGILFAGEPIEEGCGFSACVGNVAVYDLEQAGL